MKQKLIGSLFLLLVFPLQAKSDPMKPSIREVELKEYTNLTLDVVPGLGVRLIFPFILTDPVLEPSFTHSISDERVFKTPKLETEVKGQNVYVINVAPFSDKVDLSRSVLSNLFLSVNGYNISIMLRTTTNLRRYDSDVRLVMGKDDRNHLIDKVVERRIAVLQKEYEQKKKDLDKMAKKEALKFIGDVALHEPSTTNYMEEFEARLMNQERIEVFVKDAKNFNDEFYMLRYEVNSHSANDVLIHETKLTGRTDDKDAQIDVVSTCPELLPADDEIECMLVTTERALLESQELVLQLITNRGEVKVTW